MDVTTPLWSKLYSQKCLDLGIMATENLYERFIFAVTPHMKEGVLALADQSLKLNSIPIVCELLVHFQGVVHTLDLSMNPILDEGVARLLEAGLAFTSLKVVKLKSVGLSPVGFDYFFTALRKQGCCIESLDLSSTSSAERRNRPGEMGSHALAKFISANRHIKVLTFSNTQLWGGAGTFLFKNITQPSSITHLHLQNTDIHNKAVAAIFAGETASGMNILPELVHVDLSGNSSTLTSDCCQAIESGIKRLKHLHTIILSKNAPLARSLVQPFSALRYKSADLAAEAEAYKRRLEERTRWRHETFRGLCPGMKNFIDTGKVISERLKLSEPTSEQKSNEYDPSVGTAVRQKDLQKSMAMTDHGGTSANSPAPSQDVNADAAGNEDEEKDSAQYYGDTCSLRALDVSEIPLSAEAINQLAVALQTNETLESINLSYCSIDLSRAEYKAAFEAFVVSAMKLPALKALSLAGNNIGDQGAIYIGTNMANSDSLETLDLCYCGVLDPGTSSIAKAIPMCAALKGLNLKGNNATDIAARILYSSLSVYHKLTVLNLELNKISYNLYERINTLVNNNQHLQITNATAELSEMLQEQDEQLTKVMEIKVKIQEKHDILAEKCVDLVEEVDKCYREHNKWTAEIDSLQNMLDEVRKDNNVKEGKLNAINQQLSQMASKGEAEIATIELKRKQARDKASVTLNKISELEAVMQAKEIEFQETVLKPKMDQLTRLRNELDFQVKNQIRVLGILLATEQTLIAEKKISVETPQQQHQSHQQNPAERGQERMLPPRRK